MGVGYRPCGEVPVCYRRSIEVPVCYRRCGEVPVCYRRRCEVHVCYGRCGEVPHVTDVVVKYLCVTDVVVRYPQFSGASFLAFAPPRGASEHLHVSVELRPDALNGLVLFGGEFSDARLDFFSLSLVDGRAQFRYAHH